MFFGQVEIEYTANIAHTPCCFCLRDAFYFWIAKINCESELKNNFPSQLFGIKENEMKDVYRRE